MRPIVAAWLLVNFFSFVVAVWELIRAYRDFVVADEVRDHIDNVFFLAARRGVRLGILRVVAASALVAIGIFAAAQVQHTAVAIQIGLFTVAIWLAADSVLESRYRKRMKEID